MKSNGYVTVCCVGAVSVIVLLLLGNVEVWPLVYRVCHTAFLKHFIVLT